ncbi:MAG: helix-hairpin-helix domain-containing protein, partial [Oligosphaeraceae bacterium]
MSRREFSPFPAGRPPRPPASPPGSPLPEETRLAGEVLRVIFANSENGYGVVVVARANGPGEAIVAGNLAGAMPGAELQAEGYWQDHPRFGRRFQATSTHFAPPASDLGIQRYLASGCLPGVNEITAQAIVKHFGRETLEILDHFPKRLLEVPGIGKKKQAAIAKAWKELSASRDEEVFLLGLGISPAMAQRIIKHYEPVSASQIVRRNPYRLAQDIEGVGFQTCDHIALGLGVTPASPMRVSCGLAYTLRQSTLFGHVFLPKASLLQEALKLLDVPPEALEAGFHEALVRGLFLALQFPGEQELLCYPRELASQEQNLALMLLHHLQQRFPA